MSMFSELQDERACTTLSKCVQKDELTQNLWTWAHRLEVLGMALFAVLLVCGVCAAGKSAMAEEEFNFVRFLLELIPWGFYAFIEYCLYHVVALLVGALAGIYQNTKITARLQEYRLRENEVPQAMPGPAPKAQTQRAPAPAEGGSIGDGRVECPRCGTVQSAERDKCYNCGASLPR